MTRPLHQYELPARFLERFRPVKTQSREKGLAAFLFDAYGLRFYRHMTTAATLPDAAIWSVIRLEGKAALQLTHGQAGHALGYVVAQAVPGDDDEQCYPLPRRLGYRAKVAVLALQRLRHDFDGLPEAAQAVTLIDQRIHAYHHPAA